MKKILIIEDESTLRNEIGEILELEGFEVLLAENGKVGLLTSLSHLPDLILCDIMMPEMNGTEVLEKLRENINTRMIQFVFMTALADRKDIRTGMELGADDYLTKPFTRLELLNTISTRLEKTGYIETRLQGDMAHLRNLIISHVPHELRNPLNAIIGLGSFLNDNPENIDPKELKEMGRMILESGNNLFSTIYKYLTYTTLVTQPPSSYNFKRIKGTSEIISATGKEIAKSYDREGDLKMNTEDIVVFGPIDMFQLIVKELIENGFKFSDPGSVVSVVFSERDGLVEFSVHNFGRIFPEDSIAKIGAFMQFDREKHEQQGSGLGLIISKMIADLLKGNLSIESNLKSGTTITVALPISKEEL